MIRIPRHVGHSAAIACLAVGALFSATPANAQFGREYLRYSLYGPGPYGYGSKGYYQAVTTKPLGNRDPGALRPRHMEFNDTTARPEYNSGPGVLGPFGPFIYGFGRPNNVYRSLGISR